jgi:hypothetical protein
MSEKSGFAKTYDNLMGIVAQTKDFGPKTFVLNVQFDIINIKVGRFRVRTRDLKGLTSALGKTYI